MYSLVLSHAQVNRIETRALFQAAYYKKYQKEIPDKSLDTDLHEFDYLQKTPAYVVDFMIGIYGAH